MKIWIEIIIMERYYNEYALLFTKIQKLHSTRRDSRTRVGGLKYFKRCGGTSSMVIRCVAELMC